MKTTTLTVVVRMASDYDEGTRASASWAVGPDRFHIWFDVDTKVIECARLGGRPVIYKNPVKEGGYRTRYLDASAQEHAETIREVFATIECEGLVAKAEAERNERERLRRATVAAERREQRIKEAGLQLFQMLTDAVNLVEYQQAYRGSMNAEQIAAAKREIERVGGAVEIAHSGPALASFDFGAARRLINNLGAEAS